MSKPTISGRMIKCTCACAEHSVGRTELRRRYSAATVTACETRKLIHEPIGGQVLATDAGQMLAAAMQFCKNLHPVNHAKFLAELRF